MEASTGGSASLDVPERVAVIAVHGVGGPKPGATARSIARLLLRPGRGRSYGPFAEHALAIPVTRVTVSKGAGASNALQNAGRIGRYLRRVGDTLKPEDRTSISHTPFPRDAGVAFMWGQLSDYPDGDVPYETIEFVGERWSGASRTAVHVFEMHWADLSRLGGGPLKLVGALYQLLLHFSHLGRKAVDVAAEYQGFTKSEQRDASLQGHWRRLAALHAFCVRMFTMVSPAVSVLMIAAMPMMMPAAIAPPVRSHLAVALLALLCLAAAIGLPLRFFRGGKAVWIAVLASLAVVAAFATLWSAAFGADQPRPAQWFEGLFVVEWALLLASVTGYVLYRFDDAQPGAFVWGGILGALVGAVTLGFTRWMPAYEAVGLAEQLRHFGIVWVQVAFVALTFIWGFLMAGFVVSLGLWRHLHWRTLSPRDKHRTARVSWTARVSFATSAFAFVATMTLAYAAGLQALDRLKDWLPLLPHEQVLVQPIHHLLGKLAPASALLLDLVVAGSTESFWIALLGVAVIIVSFAWFAVIVAVSVVKRRNASDDWSRQLGVWITGGLRHVNIAGSVLVALVVLWILDATMHRGCALGLQVLCYTPAFDAVQARSYVTFAGQFALGVLLFILSARAWFDVLDRHVRPAVGILLDVDYYLRESPTHATPRARMAARYASLLRHVLQARRDDDAARPKFDRVIIAAHSQGTILTVDLLRFFVKEAAATTLNSDIASRVEVVTFGSPLEQLYARHFPHLYDWVHTEDDAAVAKERNQLQVAPPMRAKPQIADIGVKSWTNLYYSGDYIGRALWFPLDSDRKWLPDASVTDGSRYERCLGWGTHTSYWESAEVADEIGSRIAALPLGSHA